MGWNNNSSFFGRWGGGGGHSVNKIWTPPFSKQSPLIWSSPFLLSFFRTPHFWQLFLTISPQWNWDEHKSKRISESYFFMFRTLQNIISCFFCKKDLCKQHRTGIWFGTITVSGIKKVRRKINIFKVTLAAKL